MLVKTTSCGMSSGFYTLPINGEERAYDTLTETRITVKGNEIVFSNPYGKIQHTLGGQTLWSGPGFESVPVSGDAFMLGQFGIRLLAFKRQLFYHEDKIILLVDGYDVQQYGSVPFAHFIVSHAHIFLMNTLTNRPFKAFVRHQSHSIDLSSYAPQVNIHCS